MALADRRPLGFPVASTPTSPAFTAKQLNYSNELKTKDLKVATVEVTSSSDSNSPTDGKLEDDDEDDDNDDDDDDEGGFDHDDMLENSSDESVSMKSTINNLKGISSENDIKPLTPEKSLSPLEYSPTLRSISPDSLITANGVSTKKTYSKPTAPHAKQSVPPKKPKAGSRVPIATGISTTIPVTGEKPRPDQKGDPSLEDDVLYAIFVILFEKDPEGAGMTVKQICDILVEQHPEMANLSTKTSNLVSAKLNAYVKRVEKGDSNLKYALSRDWADASPKRMVYVYRGLLAPDFNLHVKNIMEVHKQQQLKKQKEQQSFNDDDSEVDPIDSSQTQLKSQSNSDHSFNSSSKTTSAITANTATTTAAKPRRLTMFDLGISKNTFLESPIDKSNLFVPYSSAPVTASLNELSLDNSHDFNDNFNSSVSNISNNSNKRFNNDSDFDFEDFEVFNDDEEEDSDSYLETLKKNSKRSKSMSYLSLSKKTKIITAAAAAPRVPKTPSSHCPSAAAAAAALHAAALKAMSNSSQSSPTSKSSPNVPADPSSATVASSIKNENWLNVVRSGFLTQDIGAPEDIKLSDLDKYFN